MLLEETSNKNQGWNHDNALESTYAPSHMFRLRKCYINLGLN